MRRFVLCVVIGVIGVACTPPPATPPPAPPVPLDTCIGSLDYGILTATDTPYLYDAALFGSSDCSGEPISTLVVVFSGLDQPEQDALCASVGAIDVSFGPALGQPLNSCIIAFDIDECWASLDGSAKLIPTSQLGVYSYEWYSTQTCEAPLLGTFTGVYSGNAQVLCDGLGGTLSSGPATGAPASICTLGA